MGDALRAMTRPTFLSPYLQNPSTDGFFFCGQNHIPSLHESLISTTNILHRSLSGTGTASAVLLLNLKLEIPLECRSDSSLLPTIG
jgi:hypothetical protein